MKTLNVETERRFLLQSAENKRLLRQIHRLKANIEAQGKASGELSAEVADLQTELGGEGTFEQDDLDLDATFQQLEDL